MIRTSITGLDGLQKQLKRMADGFERAKGTHEVSFGELFHPEFMRRHSRHSSIQELFDASGFKIDTNEDLAAIPDADWDRHIRSSTDFPDWVSMQKAAAGDWFKKRVGL